MEYHKGNHLQLSEMLAENWWLKFCC